MTITWKIRCQPYGHELEFRDAQMLLLRMFVAAVGDMPVEVSCGHWSCDGRVDEESLRQFEVGPARDTANGDEVQGLTD